MITQQETDKQHLEKELSQVKVLYEEAKPLIENIDEISEFLEQMRERKLAEDEAKRQEHEDEEHDKIKEKLGKKPS